MTNEEKIDVLKSEIHTEVPRSAIGARRHNEAILAAVEALEKQTPKIMVLVGDDRKKIVRCPNCNINLAVAYYTDGEITGTTCFGDIQPIAKYCKFCGQALMEVEE